ncbi:MAG: hypothetical protein ACJAS9_003567 [Polaribacter sp.]|jgi:hypothetical protein
MDPVIIFVEVVLLIGGAFFWMHFNKRIGGFSGEIAKIEAVSKKINEVIEQQKKITKATEETKADIAHLAWNKKEAQTIKRIKLEEYIEEVFQNVEIMRTNAAKTYASGRVEIGPLPVTLIAKLSTIQMLYLPELKEENEVLSELIYNYESTFDDFSNAIINIDEFNEKMIKNFSLLGSATKDISSKSKQIIEIMFEP